MAELSPKIEELFEEILKEHGEAIFECVVAHCVSGEDTFGQPTITVSQSCVEGMIRMIEELKRIALEETDKIEFEKLKEFQEKDLKEWFARLMGLKLMWFELEQMTILDILRADNGGGENQDIKR